MIDRPQEIEGHCARCKAEFMGRATDRALESWGWRKVNGEWVCNLCSGAGYGGLYRREPDEGGPAGGPHG